MTDDTSTHPTTSVEERLMLLAEAERIANMGSWIWEPGPKVIWSDQLLRILGLEPEPRPTTDDFFNALHPDDRERVRRTTEHASVTGIMPSFECRILRPDGDERIVRGAGTVIMDPDGQLVRVVGSITDITESRLASRRLKNAVRLLNDAQRVAGMGSFIYDLQRHEQEWSEGMFRLVGMPPGRTPSWTDTLSTLSPDDQQAMLAWGRHFVSGTRPPPLRYRITRADGETRTFETHAAYVPYEDEGQAGRIIGTTIDRTDQLAVEQHLQRAAHMEAIGTLAAGVAHDFNNYLAVIHAAADLLERHRPTSDHRFIEEILHAADQCAQLTRQLLAFARREPVSLALVDLRTALYEMSNILERVIGDAVRLDLKVTGPPVWTRIDPSQIENVLVNLAANARDAMPQGGRLELSLEVVEAADVPDRAPDATGTWACLAVTDTGHGIPQHLLDRIFEPYVSTKAAWQGSGLGLASAYGAMRQHAGTISVESEVGEGTTFRLWLPIAPPPATTAPEEQETGRSVTAARVLLVEDMPQVRNTLTAILQFAGHEVVAAENGEAALALIEDHPVDLVITDISMPGVGGPELVATLRQSRPALRCIFISGYFDPEVVGDLKSRYNAPVLAKPFPMDALLNAVQAALRRSGEHSK